MRLKATTDWNMDSVAGNLSQEDRPVEEMKGITPQENTSSHPNRWVIHSSKVIVCSSGFNPEKKEYIKAMVEKLGGTYTYDFTEEVTVLITIDNNSDKYRIAREETKIYTVTAKWLKDSETHDYFLKPDDYLFPLFYNRIFNFYNWETRELREKVKEYRGKIEVDINASIASGLTIVIPNQDISEYVKELRREYSFFSKAFDEKTLKLVTLPWVDSYINNDGESKNYVVEPEKYPQTSALAPKTIHHRERVIENSKTNIEETKTLKNYIKAQEINIEEHISKLRNSPDPQMSFFLMDANISMHNVFEKDDKTEIFRLINVWGAFCYESFIPGITSHIITQHPDRELIGKAGSVDNSYGPFVVTKQWLIDSIISGKRADERKYLPPSIEKVNSTPEIKVLQKRDSRKAIGKLFRGTSFCILHDSYTHEEAEEIKQKIEENQGSIISEYVEGSIAKYIIVNDGHHSFKGFKPEKDEDGKYTVSHRFIDRWLRNKKIISISRMKALDLLPFPHVLPYEEVSNICVAFTLFPKNKELVVLEEMAKLMGMKVEFSEDATTHLVYKDYEPESQACENLSEKEYLMKSSKIQIANRTFNNKSGLKVVRFEWFLQCILNGKKEEEDHYVMDIAKLFAK